MTQRRLVAAALTVVLVAVIGLIYLQVLAQGGATREAWLTTRDVDAGTVLDETNVKRVRVPAAGDQFAVLGSSPLQRRTAHRMGPQTLLTADDLLGLDTVQVPVSIRSAPVMSIGDSLDVYAVVGSRTVLVGRRLIVAGTGSPLTLLVSAADEPYWITLQANNVSLFAAKSAGVGVPSGIAGVAVNDAVSNLSGSALTGPVLASPVASGSSTPTPTAPTSVPATPSHPPSPSPTR